MAAENVDLDALIRGRSSKRRWLIGGGALGAGLVAALALVAVQPGDSDVVVEPQPVEAERGRLTSTISLSGAAASASTSELSFGISGTIASVAVGAGDSVVAGAPLAQLDDADALRRLEAAEISLRQAELRLEELVSNASASELAAARQSTASATAQLAAAEQALSELTGPPDADDADLARQSVTGAEAQAASATIALDTLLAGPTESERASADATVAQSESQLTAAINQQEAAWTVLLDAQGAYCDRGDLLVIVCGAEDIPLSEADEILLRDGLATSSGRLATSITALLSADAAYKNAASTSESAEAAVASAIARRTALNDPPTPTQIAQAEANLASAQAALDAARERERELFFGAPTSTELTQAQASVDGARAALAAAQAREAELFAGADARQVEQEQLSVRASELSVAEARDAVEALVLRSPFDGVVEAVNVAAGDVISGGATAFVVTDLDRIVVELTVTEGDLLELAVGQVGIASFDAIDDVDYPVRLLSVSRLPVIDQGVVTYAVEAEILSVTELASVADELSALRGDAPVDVGGAGASRGGGAGGSLGQLLEGVDLPDGVAIQDVLRAVVAGEPLPQGVTLPEGFELPEQLRQRLAGGDAPRVGRGAGGAEPDRVEAAPRVLPAPGMSATVTVLAEVRSEALLVPVGAVRQFGAEFVVTVPGVEGATERRIVTLGSSDGSVVEIVDGLLEGDTVLIGAETEGVPFSATQQTQPAGPGGLGAFPGGNFAFPGGGAAGGGGGARR